MHTLKSLLFLVLFCMLCAPVQAMDARLSRAVTHKAAKGKKVAELWVVDEHENAVNATRRNAKIVVLNLWATWCAPCVAELPSLSALQKRYNPSDLEVVAVSVDTNFDESARARFRRRVPDFDLPLYWDSDAMAKERISMRGVPTTLILRGDGTVLDRVDGDADWSADTIAKGFDDLLGKESNAVPSAPPPSFLTPGRTSGPVDGR